MSKKNFYAVVLGRNPGIYKEWFGEQGAEAQVRGVAKSVYKGFPTLAEAKAWFSTMAGKPPNAPANVANPTPTIPAPHPTTASTDTLLPHQAALELGKIIIYTDGGCQGNPGPGGYGTVLLYREHRKELSAGYRRTTNNRMELLACVAGLTALKQKSSVLLYSDSSYVINGIQKGWAKKWRANGWQRLEDGEYKPAKNADLWQRLLELCEYHSVELIWLKGHAGYTENERCHQLGAEAIASENFLIDEGFEIALAFATP